MNAFPVHNEEDCPFTKTPILGEHDKIKAAIVEVLTEQTISLAVAEPFAELAANLLENKTVCGPNLSHLLAQAFANFLLALPPEKKTLENFKEVVEVINSFPNLFAKIAGNELRVYAEALSIWRLSNRPGVFF